MAEQKNREAVIQNLRDAGCTDRFVSDFLIQYDKKENRKQIELLQEWRNNLLHQIHKEERWISCLDYLIYQIERTNA